MPDRTLTLRELNRATLARQMLLQRDSISVPEAIERLVGLQAQLALPPYVGLWTRLSDFKREDLAHLIEDRTVIKATLMRGTLHLFTANDYLRFRAALQPVLTGAYDSVIKQRGQGLDIKALVVQARAFIAEQPRSFAEITAFFTERYPDADPGAMRYAVRTHLPLIQVPVSTGWSYPGNPKFALAESWLGQPISEEDHLREFILRYLASFAPARVTDIQTWSGLPKLKEAVENLRPELVAYRDEQGVELFDLPDMPLPDAGTPVPVRFLPEFDNILLSHSNRTRVVADEFRSKVFLPGLRVAATFLVDGFVAGVWKIEKSKGAAAVVIEPFAPLAKSSRSALEDEAERLVRFIESSAKAFEVRFVE